jgi:hypothetical protein
MTEGKNTLKYLCLYQNMHPVAVAASQGLLCQVPEKAII